MKTLMMIRMGVVVSALASGLAPLAEAQMFLARWDFNSAVPDAAVGTGNLDPVSGTGQILGVGGVNLGFADGAGSSDPAAADDSGLSLSGWAAQGTGSGSRGLEIRVPTVGYEQVVLHWDQRLSNTGSRFAEFQITTDGLTYSTVATREHTAGGNVWVNGLTLDLAGVPGVADNPDFGIRMVSVFESGGSGAYVTAGGGSYSTAGTWRFDQVGVSGTPLTAVPEPSEYGLAVGLVLTGFVWWRRRHRG